ncbi:cytochrome P450 [Lojkania enalia]|uniref:Cytochrome P450 n=1 Tax=Lojkania enalia TaxID=147567 RepID=A0A9P4K6U8_9PLEO|nr:cytochrome P450 [Didymosphaeria enalia]
MEKHAYGFIELTLKDGTTIDFQPLFHKLSLDIASDFLFGRSTNVLNQHKDDKAVEEFVKAFENCISPHECDIVKKFGALREFPPDSQFKRFVKTTCATPNKEPYSKPHCYSFLTESLSQTSDREQIGSEPMNIIVPGYDTTASLLTNLIWQLSREPKILARPRQGMHEHVGEDVPTYEQLKDMPYLKAVINEIQRLYPIVPSDSRQAAQDIVLPRAGSDGNAQTFPPPPRAYTSDTLKRKWVK